MCGKVYIFDPLKLTEPADSLDLMDDFLPLTACLFSVLG